RDRGSAGHTHRPGLQHSRRATERLLARWTAIERAEYVSSRRAGRGRVGVEGGGRGSLGGLATAVAGAVVVLGGVETWAAEVTARSAQALSANALRSVELTQEMRWQLTRLTPGPGDEAALDPSTAEALLGLSRDVRAYETLATSEAGRQEW